MKTAVVTGASRGIGAATARLLAVEGYTVVGVYHESAAQMQTLAQEYGIVPIAADLSQSGEILPLAQRILTELPHIDALVHAAGVARHGLFQTMTRQEIQPLYAVNLDSVLELTRALLPKMIARHQGTIVCVSSIWGEIGGACEVDYSVTKGALLALVRSLAREVGLSGIRVNAVSPGTIFTDMTAPLGEETLSALAAETALGRLGTVDDVAAVIRFLISEDAGYITGADIPVNGGM